MSYYYSSITLGFIDHAIEKRDCLTLAKVKLCIRYAILIVDKCDDDDGSKHLELKCIALAAVVG